MTIPTPPWHRATRPDRRPLNQQLIVDAALGILDREGLDAVTMRRVAQQLGTGAASLYAHVSSKDELRELMLDRVLDEIRIPDPDPARWREQLKEVGRETVRIMVSRPGIAQASLEIPIPIGPGVLVIGERVLAIFRAGGLSDKVAGLAVDLFALYTTATAVEASLWAVAEKTGVAAEKIGQIQQYMQSLPADRFPLTVAMTAATAGIGGEERFEFGLDVLIAGIEAVAARMG